MQKSVPFLHNEQSEKEITGTIPFTMAIKNT